jgi:hypothetical protein
MRKDPPENESVLQEMDFLKRLWDSTMQTLMPGQVPGPVLVELPWLKRRCADSIHSVVDRVFLGEVRGALIGMVQGQGPDYDSVEITMLFCAPEGNCMIYTFKVPWNETSIIRHLNTPAAIFLKPELIKDETGNSLINGVNRTLMDFVKHRRVPGQLVGYHPTIDLGSDLGSARYIPHRYFQAGGSESIFSCNGCRCDPPPAEFVSYDLRNGKVDFRFRFAYGELPGPVIQLDARISSFDERTRKKCIEFDNVIALGLVGRELWGELPTSLIPLVADPNTPDLPYCLWSPERQRRDPDPEAVEARRLAEVERMVRAMMEP